MKIVLFSCDCHVEELYLKEVDLELLADSPVHHRLWPLGGGVAPVVALALTAVEWYVCPRLPPIAQGKVATFDASRLEKIKKWLREVGT